MDPRFLSTVIPVHGSWRSATFCPAVEFSLPHQTAVVLKPLAFSLVDAVPWLDSIQLLHRLVETVDPSLPSFPTVSSMTPVFSSRARHLSFHHSQLISDTLDSFLSVQLFPRTPLHTFISNLSTQIEFDVRLYEDSTFAAVKNSIPGLWTALLWPSFSSLPTPERSFAFNSESMNLWWSQSNDQLFHFYQKWK